MEDDYPVVKALRDKADDETGILVPGAAVGALPNGARIQKGAMREGDSTPTGTPGTVLASHGPVADPYCGQTHYGYFVTWDTAPGVPVFVSGCTDRLVLLEG